MTTKKFLRAFVIALALLLVPFTASRFVEGWNWEPMDYVFAFVMFFTFSFAFEVVAAQSNKLSYRIGATAALLTTFMLVWGNLAVGVIGEDNPANALYMLVPMIGLMGAASSMLKAGGLSYTLFIMSFATAAIPVIAFFAWRPIFDEPPGLIGVIVLNAFFVFMFAFAGILFRHASRDQRLTA